MGELLRFGTEVHRPSGATRQREALFQRLGSSVRVSYAAQTLPKNIQIYFTNHTLTARNSSSLLLPGAAGLC